MGGVFGLPHRHRGWQVDLDTMTYEELLALEDRIGRVNTGLRRHEIKECVVKYKFSKKQLLDEKKREEKRCSICLERYRKEDDVGKLQCGHGYHYVCIKQWLKQKNKCPICRSEAADRSNKPTTRSDLGTIH